MQIQGHISYTVYLKVFLILDSCKLIPNTTDIYLFGSMAWHGKIESKYFSIGLY